MDKGGQMEKTKEVPTAALLPSPDDVLTTRLRRAATGLLIISLVTFHGLWGVLGVVASLTVLLASSDSMVKKARCIKVFATMAGIGALFSGVMLTGALVTGMPARHINGMEDQCNTIPSATFEWGEGKLRTWKQEHQVRDRGGDDEDNGHDERHGYNQDSHHHHLHEGSNNNDDDDGYHERNSGDHGHVHHIRSLQEASTKEAPAKEAPVKEMLVKEMPVVEVKTAPVITVEGSLDAISEGDAILTAAEIAVEAFEDEMEALYLNELDAGYFQPGSTDSPSDKQVEYCHAAVHFLTLWGTALLAMAALSQFLLAFSALIVANMASGLLCQTAPQAGCFGAEAA